jgi:hypothetical protein
MRWHTAALMWHDCRLWLILDETAVCNVTVSVTVIVTVSVTVMCH